MYVCWYSRRVLNMIPTSGRTRGTCMRAARMWKTKKKINRKTKNVYVSRFSRERFRRRRYKQKQTHTTVKTVMIVLRQYTVHECTRATATLGRRRRHARILCQTLGCVPELCMRSQPPPPMPPSSSVPTEIRLRNGQGFGGSHRRRPGTRTHCGRRFTRTEHVVKFPGQSPAWSWPEKSKAFFPPISFRAVRY